jgi:hypothetical protein
VITTKNKKKAKKTHKSSQKFAKKITKKKLEKPTKSAKIFINPVKNPQKPVKQLSTAITVTLSFHFNAIS